MNVLVDTDVFIDHLRGHLATALERELTLMARNLDGFSKVTGLHVRLPS